MKINDLKIGTITPKQYLEAFSSNVLHHYFYIFYEFDYGNVLNELVFKFYPTTASSEKLAQSYLSKSFAHCLKVVFRQFVLTDAVFNENYFKKEDFIIKYNDIYYKDKYWGFISDFNMPKGKYHFVCHVFPPLTTKLVAEGKLPANEHSSFDECKDYAQKLFTIFAKTLVNDFSSFTL